MPPVSCPLENQQHESSQESTGAVHNNKNNAPLPFSTPPIRPTPPSSNSYTTSKGRTNNKSKMSSTTGGGARRKISPLMPAATEEEDDYNRFVQSLGEDDPLMVNTLESFLREDEEEDFVLTDLDEEDDDDDEDDVLSELAAVAPSSPTTTTSTEHDDHLSASPLPLEHTDFYSELEAELGSLLEEDLEAAVSTLLAGSNNNTKRKPASPTNNTNNNMGGMTPIQTSTTSTTTVASPQQERTTTTATTNKSVVTPKQVQRLQKLMQSHYQLLVQSSVLSVRAAQKEYPEESPLVFHGGESPEDFGEILDGAVGMLLDLDQNRKDAIRNYIQRMETTPQAAQRSLLPQLKGSTNKRLTRSAFHSLQESTNAHTIFDVDGLYSLKQTFRTIDHCGKKQLEGLDVLEPVQHFDACRQLLEQAGAKIDEGLLPGKRDLSTILCDSKEAFGNKFTPPTSIPQQIQLRKNRNQFTAAEDNLILRGVNLYGEKQWILIADRYLPDRSVNIISQRYSKLCLMIYKANGVRIDANGNLPTPPRFEKVDQLDEAAISKIKPASAPAILNVHRWSIEEDVTLLKAVPFLGNQWAELSSRLIPHRDRGHLRKRYQVLERRVKATVTRNKRGDVPAIPRTTPRTTPAAALRRPSKKQPKKRKAEEIKTVLSNPPGSIIRGRMPAHLLCPPNASNGAKHPGAKAGRKTMEFPARRSPTAKRPLPHEPESDRANGGGYAYANGGYVQSSSGFAQSGGGYAQSGGGGFHPSPGADTNHSASRFETILSETTDDWSQMSRMRRMMDNETESMVASAIIKDLANGPRDPPPNVEQLPQMEVQSSSGFSMLHNNSGNARDVEHGKDPETPPKHQNGSIMASVLERTRKEGPQNASPGEENTGVNMEAHAGVPSTPSRPPNRYPLSSYEYGTPLGASPGPGLQMRNFFSPGGHKHGQSPGIKGYSPDPMNSLMMGAVPSNNDYELYPLDISEASRQAMENSAGVSTAKPPGMSHPNTPVDFHDSHGLKSTDLEAISALNSLSNSPAKFLQKRPTSSDGTKDENGKSSKTSKSLFAAAVGAVEQKQDDRKKRRTK